MKRVIYLVAGLVLMSTAALAQKIDDARMTRDIAVAENILSTLIKQEFDKRNFFPVEVKGNYQPGYGIMFSVPAEVLSTMAWGMGGQREVMVLDGTPGAYTFSWSDDDVIRERAEIELKRSKEELKRSEKELEKSKKEMEKSKEELERVKEMQREQEVRALQPRIAGSTLYRTRAINIDSIREVSNTKLIAAAKNFIADYGDMISQLAPEERIVVSNRGGDAGMRWYGQSAKRSLLSVEATKADISSLKQGKITRDQFLAKVKVVNTSSTGKAEPDMELLTSIFNRLYRSDLSSNFFVEGNIYYDRLTDYGAVVYMQVYSSNQIEDGLYSMPTVDLRAVDQATRDKKVKELYPAFEAELKENIVEYGRTVKSLNDNEQLIFNVKLTRCTNCGIPADIEVSVKSSVLKEYNAGKIDKNTALSKVTVKKGPLQ